jgi:hypothetical protein
MTTQLPFWVLYVQALGTPFAAMVFGAITSWIAYQQWRTARDRVRLDVFKLRYRYFLSLRDFMISIIQDGNTDLNKHSQYVRKMVGSEFVFNKELTAYIEDVRLNSIKLWAKTNH